MKGYVANKCFVRATEPMIGRALADVGDAPHMVPYQHQWRATAGALTTGWRRRGGKRRRLRPAIGHALSFTTWRSPTATRAWPTARRLGGRPV
jgi:hypothetical protein